MILMNFQPRRLRDQWPLLFAGLFLLLWLATYISVGLYDALNFDGFPADGPFQLFNPLRRIADGQRAGVDFQFFHGIGVPFLHYPLFWAFGKIYGQTVFTSELSRYFTALACYLLSLGLFAFAATGGKFKKSVYFVAFALCLSEMFGLGQPGLYGNALALPGNSLLGARSTLPILTFALLLSRLPRAAKALGVGACAALALYFGTEHGLALNASFYCIGACVLVKSWFIERRTQRLETFLANLKFYALAGAATFVTGVLIYLVTCGPQGALQALRYNLIEVPADQFWYFGVPPNDFASSLADFPHASIKGVLLFLIAACWLLACLWLLFRATQAAPDSRVVTTAHMLCYGLVSCASCLGMLEKGYLSPLLRVFLFALLALVFHDGILELVADRLSTLNFGTRRALRLGFAVLLLVSFASIGNALYARIPAPVRIFGAGLPRLSPLWTKRLATATQAMDAKLAAGEKPVIWSTYAGLLEARYGVFHPKDDYIIHALGPRRREAYANTFRTVQPRFVQTVRRALFISYTEKRDYEQWLRDTSWDFYEDLLNNYDVLTTTDSAIFWARKNGAWVAPSDAFKPLAVNPGVDCLELPANSDAGQIVVVRLRYQVSNPWKRLPFVGGLPRFLVTPENTANDLPVSLAPYANEVRFPLYVKPGVRPKLNFAVRSLLPGASFAVTEVTYKVVPVSPSQAVFLQD